MVEASGVSAIASAQPRRRWFRRRRRDERRALTELDVPWMFTPTRAGVPMSPQLAARLLDVWACVRLLSETTSCLPLVVYRGRGADRVPVEDGLAELLGRPSPGATMANLVCTTVAHMAVRGEAFWGKFRDGEGFIQQVAPIPPDRVDVEVIGGEPFYRLNLDSGATLHTISDVLHIKLLSWDGVRGISPVAQAREALGLAAATVETASALFGNQAIPRGILAVRAPGPEGDELRENLSGAINDRHGGPPNAGRVSVVDADAVSYAPVGMTAADAELLAHRRLSSTEVARLMRCPAALLDADTGSSLVYSNAQTAADNLLRFSLQPYLTALEQAVSADHDLCAPDEQVSFDTSAFLRADPATRAQFYSSGITAGWLRPEDARAAEWLPPTTGEPAHANA
jgi:HK97 family phage portal protein